MYAAPDCAVQGETDDGTADRPGSRGSRPSPGRAEQTHTLGYTGCILGRCDARPLWPQEPRHDRSASDGGNPVRILGLIHVVSRQEDRHLLIPAHSQHVFPAKSTCLRIEAHVGLSGNKTLGRVQHPAGEPKPPDHVAGDDLAPHALVARLERSPRQPVGLPESCRRHSASNKEVPSVVMPPRACTRARERVRSVSCTA